MTKNENSLIAVSVVAITGLNKSTKSIRLQITDKVIGKNFDFKPGQYIMVGILGFGEAPLTITTAPAELPEFEIAVRSAGVATQAMLRLKKGDRLFIRGPYGNSILTDTIYGKPVVLVAGGIGLAPLRSTIHVIRDDKTIVGSLTILCGAKTPEELIFKGELADWAKFATVHLVADKADHQWTGETGRVPDSLKQLKLAKDTVVIVCGPPVMYQSIVDVLLEKGLAEENIQFMLERRMKCGIGKCQHCTCGDKYVCIDGPTFGWDELKHNPEALS
jgi:sulfhydrogenase subunit gamma (sulfur reductase)